MDPTSLIVSLISGIIGGNVAGAAMQDKNLGVLGNSITGLIGGGAGSYILQALDLFQRSAGTSGLSMETPAIIDAAPQRKPRRVNFPLSSDIDLHSFIISLLHCKTPPIVNL